MNFQSFNSSKNNVNNFRKQQTFSHAATPTHDKNKLKRFIFHFFIIFSKFVSLFAKHFSGEFRLGELKHEPSLVSSLPCDSVALDLDYLMKFLLCRTTTDEVLRNEIRIFKVDISVIVCSSKQNLRSFCFPFLKEISLKNVKKHLELKGFVLEESSTNLHL